MSEYGLEGRHRLSRKSTDCKNINLWHSANGTATEEEVAELIAAFVRGLQPELVVETGAYVGYTSRMIGEALQKNGHGQLVAIENSLKHFRLMRSRCRGLPVQPVYGSSLEWVPPENWVTPIEFAFFDTNYPTRKSEFDHFRPYMNKYTIICWHDSGWHFENPIREHIEELAKLGNIQPLFLPTPRGVCFARVLE